MGQHKGLIFTALGVLVLIGILFVSSKTGLVPLPNQMTKTPAPTEAPLEQNQITIENLSYAPANLIIKVGDTVTWVNKDEAPHTATSDDNSFDTGFLRQNETASIVFDTPGTFSYHSTADNEMHGTIIVE